MVETIFPDVKTVIHQGRGRCLTLDKFTFDKDGNPFAKETWNMTEQGKMFRENPEQARQLAAAAGVKL